MKAVKHEEKDDDGLKTVWYEAEIVAENKYWLTDTTSFYADGISESDSIITKLETLAERTNYPTFKQ